jgi:FXSXX-COOH protein
MSDEETGIDSDLIDLDGVLLVDLNELDDSALAHALRRVLADADGSENPIAAFQSFI